jgi:predicted nucleotidyltransferase
VNTGTVDPALDPIVAALRRVLAAGPPLRLAILFGSAARGQLRPSSDLDVAIWPLDPTLPLAAEMDLQSELELALARPVDLVRLDTASTLVCWYVARDGVLLEAHPPVEWPRFRARAASDYADFRPSLEEAARRLQRRLASQTER